MITKNELDAELELQRATHIQSSRLSHDDVYGYELGFQDGVAWAESLPPAWFSTKERIPSVDRYGNSLTVIFYTFFGIYVGYVKDGTWTIKLPGGEIAFPHDEKYITHWMYMPKNPQK